MSYYFSIEVQRNTDTSPSSYEAFVNPLPSLLLRLPRRFPERPPSDILMHASIDLDQLLAPLTHEAGQEPMHQTMAPVRRAREGNVLRTTAASNLPQHSTNELLRVRHQERGFPNLGHGGGDEVGLDALDKDAVGFEF